MPEFTCRTCGDPFTLPQNVLDRYPGWTPAQCRSCRDAEGGDSPRRGGAASRAGRSAPAPPSGVAADPTTGVFTDGSSVPNPGPGGWAAVYVVDDRVVAEDYGADPDTTNNRMELTALIRAVDLVPEGTAMTVYSDSHLAVRTITEWAEGWKRNGWRRKTGPVENLDLVKEAYEVYRRRPDLRLEWIKAHAGFRWNEYADELANKGRAGG